MGGKKKRSKKEKASLKESKRALKDVSSRKKGRSKKVVSEIAPPGEGLALSRLPERSLDPKITELLSAVTELVSKVAVERDTPNLLNVGRHKKVPRFFPDLERGEKLKELFKPGEQAPLPRERAKTSVVCSLVDQFEHVTRYLDRKQVSWELIGRLRRSLSTRSRNVLWGVSAAAILGVVTLTVAMSAREPWQANHHVLVEEPVSPNPDRWLNDKDDFQSGQIQEVAMSFLNATSISQMLSSVRNPEYVEPLMVNFYKEPEFAPQDIAYIEVKEGVQLQGMRLVVVRCLYRDFSKRLMNLVDEGGGYRVDWESFVEFSQLTWEELKELRPRQSIQMRLWVEKSEVFVPEYPPEEWDCYYLSSTGGVQSVYGYINRNNPMAAEMQRLFDDDRSLPALVGIAYPEFESGSDHLTIETLYQRGWLAGLESS